MNAVGMWLCCVPVQSIVSSSVADLLSVLICRGDGYLFTPLSFAAVEKEVL